MTRTITNSQTRVHHGNDAQQFVLKSLISDGATLVSTAIPGSTNHDIVVLINGQLVSFEIKHIKTQTSPIAILNDTLHRYPATSSLDNYAKLLTGQQFSIVELIDNSRAWGNNVGFCADDVQNIPISGRLPKIESSDIYCMDTLRARLIDSFISNKISYFTTVDSNFIITTYHTGYGTNVLHAPVFPKIKTAAIKTYGSSSIHSIRIALKIIMCS